MSDQQLIGFLIILALASVLAVTLLEELFACRRHTTINVYVDDSVFTTSTAPSKAQCMNNTDDVDDYFDDHVKPMLTDQR